MKLDATKFGIATAAAFAVLWVICSLLAWGMPSVMMGMTGHMMHSDWSNMGWHVSAGGVFAGLIAWSLFAGVCAWLLAVIYNRLL